MLARTILGSAMIALLALGGACTRVGNIQQTAPVQTMKFKASHKQMAQCLQARTGGQTKDDAFGSSYIIFDSVKGSQADDGISHYSYTVTDAGSGEATVAWRAVVPHQAGRRGGSDEPPQATVQKYWANVEACAAQLAGAK